MAIVLDKLVTQLGFTTNLQGLRQFDRAVSNVKGNLNTLVANGTKVASTLGIALGAAGAGAAKVGITSEKSFLKLQTQLGETEEGVERAKKELGTISEDTNRPLNELADAFFNLKSSVPGIADDEAFEIIRQSAKAAAIELGRTDAVALATGVAVTQMGSDVLSGNEAIDKLSATIKEGAIPNAESLASGLGQVILPAKNLNITMDELLALIAGFTRTGAPVSETLNAIRSLLVQLYAPTKESQKVLAEVFEGALDPAAELRKRLEEDFFGTLKQLREELGDQPDKLRRVVGEITALNVVLDAGGNKNQEYIKTLQAIESSTGQVNEGFQNYKDSGAAGVEEATNSARLALIGFYNKALAPLFKLFSLLPGSVQATSLALVAFAGIARLTGTHTLFLAGAKWAAVTATRALMASTILIRIQLLALSIQTGISTAVQWAWNFAQGAGRAIALASIAVMYIMAIALGTLAGVTGIATAAQWLLNIALTANPIGIIIVAIGVLIAALAALGYAIYKFTKSWELAAAAVLLFLGPIGWLIAAGLIIYKFRDTVIGAFQSIFDFVTGLPAKMFEAGKDFMLSFVDGILSVVDKVVGAVKGVFGKIRDFLPFSDARVGPLSDLTKSGRQFIATFLDGIDDATGKLTGNVQNAMRKAADLLPSSDAKVGPLSRLTASGESFMETLAMGMRQAEPLPLADLLLPALPIGPIPPPAANGGGKIELSITIERVEIIAPGGDPQTIAAQLGDTLSEASRALVEEVDSLIRA